MGIPFLLSLLKSIVVKRHLKEYKDQIVAVDVYTWLHPAIYTCAYELANNIETTKHIDYCVKKVDQILGHGIKKIVLVFDGRQLPSKKGTEEKREKSREDNKNEALRLMIEGKKDLANKKFACSVDVTPQMAYEFIQAVQGRHNVECIVSPYEADAQLAYLSKIGYVDVIFSEDSDLLAFGCKKVLFKDKNERYYDIHFYSNINQLYKGEQKDYGDEICLDNIKNCREINMSLWDHNMFLIACIFSGCDYLPSLKKMGTNTAFKLVGEHKLYKKCLLTIQQKNYEIPSYYDEKFQLAFLTFRFQLVYCPLKEKIVHLNNYDLNALKAQYVDKDFHNTNYQISWKDFEENVLIVPLIYKILNKDFDWSFLGDMDELTAIKVAQYLIDPTTLEPYKEVKQKGVIQERNTNLPVKMGSSLLNKNIFEKKSKINQSVSNSILQGKQSQISSFIKVGVSKSSIQKSQSNDSNQCFDRYDFLLEDASSNQYSKSKINEKQLDMMESQFIYQIDENIFSKGAFNKNSSIFKPFKLPSSQDSQNSQNNSFLSKKKSTLKRTLNDDYFFSEEKTISKDEYMKDVQIIESQLEDRNSDRKDNENEESSNFQNLYVNSDQQKQYQKKNEFIQEKQNVQNQQIGKQNNSDGIKNNNNINNKSNINNNNNYNINNITNINIQTIHQQQNNLLNFSNYKSNLLIEKNIINNLSKDQQIFIDQKNETNKKITENQKLSKKFQKNLVIDKTPIHEIKVKDPQSLFKYNFSLQKINKIQDYSNKENINEDEYSYSEMINTNQDKDQNKRSKEENEYYYDYFNTQNSQQIQYDSNQEENQSNMSTQSQEQLAIQQNKIKNNLNSLQKQIQKITYEEVSYPKKLEKEAQPLSDSSSMINICTNNRNQANRLENFSKVVDGNIIVNSEYLMKQHPEYNFIDKFSIFFKNELNI